MPGRRHLQIVAITMVIALFAASTPCHAEGNDKPAAPANDQAIKLFEQSEVAYQQGRFADALELLRRSYALHKEPVLLYNMGRAYEGLGDIDGATKAYKQFLAEQPNTPDRGAIEQHLVTFERQKREREELRRSTSDERSASAVPWIVAGVGVLGVGAGVVLGVLAKGRNDDAAAAVSYRDAADLHDDAKTMATVANACFIAGGAVVLAGIIWGVIDLSRSGKRSGAAPNLVLRF